MKLFNRPSNRSKGFTLIELLIVIALIGALAVGLIAALDPIEQLRRGSDTALRDVAAQFFHAQNRYYASKYQYTANYPNFGSAAGTNVQGLVGSDVLTLINSGELKTQYTTNLNKFPADGSPAVAQVIVFDKETAGTPDAIVVCFRPKSKQFTTNTSNIYNGSGVAQGAAAAGLYTCIE